MLKVQNVSKNFGDIVALSEISFDVSEGDFVFIKGHSGAGKTTLIRLILRELLPTSGEIFLDSIDITKIKNKEVPKIRQKIGVVFQDFKVMPEKTLRENVQIALAVVGVDRSEWKARVDHVLNLVGLIDRSELFPSQLSGGEVQRASLARALVVNPSLILADEPTGNLDWETADKIMELFAKVNSEGKTILIATHHELIVKKYAQKVVELKAEGFSVEKEKMPDKDKKDKKTDK